MTAKPLKVISLAFGVAAVGALVGLFIAASEDDPRATVWWVAAFVVAAIVSYRFKQAGKDRNR